jgi:hypothetical protein
MTQNQCSHHATRCSKYFMDMNNNKTASCTYCGEATASVGVHPLLLKCRVERQLHQICLRPRKPATNKIWPSNTSNSNVRSWHVHHGAIVPSHGTSCILFRAVGRGKLMLGRRAQTKWIAHHSEHVELKTVQSSLRVAQDSSACNGHGCSTKRLQMPQIMKRCMQEAAGVSHY